VERRRQRQMCIRDSFCSKSSSIYNWIISESYIRNI
jgi:hypothetical protein